MAAAQADENHEEAMKTKFKMRDIHQLQLEPTHKNSQAAAEAPSLKISFHGTSLK